MRDRYAAQVRLIMDVLPTIAAEPEFALKGGTAINLFHRDLPRLSVDVDLTFLPVRDRGRSLVDIDAALRRIVDTVSSGSIRASPVIGREGYVMRIVLQRGNAMIKVEASPVNRGAVFASELRRVVDRVENEFGFAEARIVSLADLYGGKLHAALDRQHPRDLFDVKLLYENEGLTPDIFRAFLVYLAGSNRPPHELLDPRPKNMNVEFEKEFDGMSSRIVTAENLASVHAHLVRDVRDRLTGGVAIFLRTLVRAVPDFDAIGLPDAAALPAVRWKIRNVETLMERDPGKHGRQVVALESLLS